jgi:transketolase
MPRSSTYAWSSRGKVDSNGKTRTSIVTPQKPKALLEDLAERAKSLRSKIIQMTTQAGSGHPTSSLSAVEVVTALYFAGLLRYDPKKPTWPDRDRFILSKGHAAPVLYAALAEAGYFPADELATLRELGSRLEGHPNMRRLPGVEASTGSLGQGLSIGIGHALAARLDQRDYRVWVMLGDGEIAEGQVWEAVAAAEKYKLDSLTAIVDHNGYQQTGTTKEVLDLDPIGEKFAAFGWNARTINGHDLAEVVDALEEARRVKGKPQAIVALTEKGHGIKPLLTELGDPNYHGKALPPDAARRALEMIGGP